MRHPPSFKLVYTPIQCSCISHKPCYKLHIGHCLGLHLVHHDSSEVDVRSVEFIQIFSHIIVYYYPIIHPFIYIYTYNTVCCQYIYIYMFNICIYTYPYLAHLFFVAIKSGNAEDNDLTLCYGKIDHRIFDVPTKKWWLSSWHTSSRFANYPEISPASSRPSSSHYPWCLAGGVPFRSKSIYNLRNNHVVDHPHLHHRTPYMYIRAHIYIYICIYNNNNN